MFYAYVSPLLFTFCHRSLGCQSFPPLLGLVPRFKKRFRADNLNPDTLVTGFVAPYIVRTHLEKMKTRKYRNRPGQSGNTESRNLVRAILSLTIAHGPTPDRSR